MGNNRKTHSPQFSSRQETSVTAGQYLFSLLPPAFAAVPQYFVHITVELLSLTEPDKRLSHTSDSSVHHSVRLRPTTRVQVFADSQARPLHPDQCPGEALPGVCLALALAVKPFKQDMFDAIDIIAAPFCVIRYGVIVQIPDHPGSGLPEHLPFSEHPSGLFRPIAEVAQTYAQLLATGAALDLEVSPLGLAAIMRKTQKGKLLWLLAALVCIFSCIAAKLDAARFLLRQLQTKAFQPVLQAPVKILCLALVLKAGQKVIGEPKIMRLTATLPAHPFAEPQVQHVMKVDVREQRRYNGPLGRAFFRGPHQALFHDTAFKHPDDQSDDPLICDAVPQKLDHPLVVDPVEKTPDIGLHHVADPLLLDRASESLQAVVLAAAPGRYP